jgi:hypothetical protein
MEAAPRSVNYADTLPLAVASTQNRRSFFPQNGQNFTDTGSNIIRIDVQADGLLDCQQSYLEFTLTNLVNNTRTLDQGHPWIKRLTLESGGVILEDINNYNRLVGGILTPAQGSAGYTGEIQCANFGSQNSNNGAPGAVVALPQFMNSLAAVTTAAGAADAQTAANATGVIAANGAAPAAGGTPITGQYHLVCGLLNMDKYLPLVLMGQGFTIVIELETGNNIGICPNAAAANPQNYQISNVKYVAHIVEMQRDFYDMLRNLQAQSGGSLMIGSSTFRHYSHAFTPTQGNTEEVNISARVRSLENLLWCSNRTDNISNNQFYNLSNSSPLGCDAGSYAVFVGAQRYPNNQVNWDNAVNKGEAYQELRKCFGALGSINHGGFLNAGTYLSDTDARLCTLAGGTPRYACFGLSFRSFRHELEDGIDTSSRALPIRLQLNTKTVPGGGAGNAQTMDIYAQATILFYINMDGSVTASV